MFKHSARRLLSYSLKRNQILDKSNSALTSASQQTVTLVLDDKPVTLSFGDDSKPLQSFLDEVNSHQSEESSHYNSATNSENQLSIDPRQSLGEIFAATNNICLQSSNSNKQLVIARPSGALNGDTINHQELINLANELNKRLQESEVTRQLHAEANNLDNQIEPMYEELVKLEKTTNDTTDISLLAFLSVWTMSTVSIGRLTWWEFSWDIMEPVAWATQAGAMLFWGWYYFITRNENSMSDLQNRIKNKKLVKKLQKHNFNTDKYNQLIQRRKEVDDQLAKFKRW